MREVKSTRSIDVDRVISELDSKINKKQENKEAKGRFYEVVVNKQLLIDARDVLKYYYDAQNSIKTTEDDLK